MEIHSTNNEGKSVVAETFIRTLRQKKKKKIHDLNTKNPQIYS